MSTRTAVQYGSDENECKRFRRALSKLRCNAKIIAAIAGGWIVPGDLVGDLLETIEEIEDDLRESRGGR